MKFLKLIGLLLFLTPIVHAGNLISSMTWSESGDYKMPREDQVPWHPGGFCSTCTISRIWDGTTIKLFGGKGELVTWVTYIMAGGAGDALNVMVTISSFTGVSGNAVGSGFAAVAVSSTNVWDYTQRPYSLYKYSYLQVVGMGQLGITWDPSEYDMFQEPERWATPCTVNASNTCLRNAGTYHWANRQDHDKFYPDIAVPMEEFTPPANSSFTVGASSSQAIGGEVYISSNTLDGTYSATLTVWEGATISTSIPISLIVYKATLPVSPTIPVLGFMEESDLAMRFTGVRSPGNFYIEPYLTTGLRTAAFLHRHKVTQIGDRFTSGTQVPSAGYTKHLDGSAYKEAYGLSSNTGPGYGIADSIYMVGTYGSWRSANWSTTITSNGSTGYCDNVSGWVNYCTTNGINCQLYTSVDEASVANLQGEVNRESTWSSTAPACAFNGHRLPYLQTGTLPTVATNAPNVNSVLSAGWMAYSTQTWANEEAYYHSLSSFTVGGYNQGIGVDSLNGIQEEGLGPREVMWGAYKTNQAMWFEWEIGYWQDGNNGGQVQNGWNANTSGDNNLFNLSKTFGYDVFPTTSDTRGHTGFNFSPTDGNMIYPGTELVYSSPNYGVQAIFGSWRLNMLTRGIQDADILALAFSVDPSSTTNILNQQVQDVMYLRQCHNLADCTYSYGPRPWNETLDTWELARERLLKIAAGAPPPVITPPSSDTYKGTITINGGVTIQ